MNRHVVVKKLPDFDGREIVISDLHGSLDAYEKLLDKCGYKPGEDRLILLGDLVEKGHQNLALLRKIMHQTQTEDVHCLMGNCDFTAKNFLYSYRLAFIKSVLLERKGSLIHEMIAEAGLEPLSDSTDMDQLALQLRRHYLKELSFLNDLPHVIETPKRIYAHAGIQDEKTFAEDFRDVMTCPLFGETRRHFTKMVVVGHMPVTEYCRHKGDFNPRFHPESNVLSIDGGNVVKKPGQLNAVLFHGPIMETRSVSLLPEARALRDTRPRNAAPFFVGWNNGDVVIVRQEEHQSLVYSPYLRRHFWIDNSFLKNERGTDFTNYEMPLHYGETVEVVTTYGKKTQIKKLGILGWTLSENLEPVETTGPDAA